ncbi:MAG TPA: polyprenyl synthetase family protein [Acidobacteriota bacterium]
MSAEPRSLSQQLLDLQLPDRMSPRQILALVETDLEQVEQILAKVFQSDISILAQAGQHVSSGGGKRIRPTLLLLTSRLCGLRGGPAILFAAMVELIHTATLIHDDIIDHADTRRGLPSINRRFGEEVTVLFGDYLYLTAVSMGLEPQYVPLLKVLSETTLRMIEGELISLQRSGDLELTEAEYLDIIERKTGRLFSACGEIPALLAGLDPAACGDLKHFGMRLGTAFQLIDDLFDLSTSAELLGKPVLSDLTEGKLTLPLILLLRRAGAEVRAKVGTVLAEHAFRSISAAEILELATQYRTLEDTRALADRLVAEAQKLIEPFPDSIYRTALSDFAELVIHRPF